MREAPGATRHLGSGHLATVSPGRTGVTIARHVTEGRDPDSKDPAHDEVTVHGLSDGHVFKLSPHRDGIVDRRIQNSHDGKSLWMLVRHGPTKALMRYDGPRTRPRRCATCSSTATAATSRSCRAEPTR